MVEAKGNSIGKVKVSAIYTGLFLGFILSLSPMATWAANYGSGPYGRGDYGVGQSSTTTSLASSLNPSTFGASVRLTATVTGATGTVTFKKGAVTLGSGTLGHGSGAITLSSLAVGSHSLTAVYGGATNYLTSTSSTLTQIVNQASTTTTLMSSLNPSDFGSSVTITASVAPSTATGTLTFKDAVTTLGTASVGHGSGKYVTSAFAVGNHSLTAVYGGNQNYVTSTSSPLTQSVGLATTTSTLVSGTNPSTYGTNFTLTATISPSNATGTFTFKDGSTTIGTGTIGHGSGKLTLSTLGGGSRSVTAVYEGDSSYGTSTTNTVTQVVNAATSTTTLVSSLNPSTLGNQVTLSASVSPSSATGTLTFKSGSSTIGSATLGHGSGSFSTTALSAGSNSLTAVYSGNLNFLTSTSNTLTQTVTQAASTSSSSPDSQPASQSPTGGGRGRGGVPARRGTSSSQSPDTGAGSSVPGESSTESLQSRGGKLIVTIENKEVVIRDVPVSTWYAPYVAALLQSGIASGYKDSRGNLTGLFGPSNPVTEAEILKMAIRVGGKPLSEGSPQNRSAKSDWSAGYVKTAEDLHLSVYQKSLDVRTPATRGEVIQTLLELLGTPVSDGAEPFSDVRENSPFAKAIATAAQLGIITGDTDKDGKPTGHFRPNASINRAEVAKIISVAKHVLKK